MGRVPFMALLTSRRNVAPRMTSIPNGSLSPGMDGILARMSGSAVIETIADGYVDLGVSISLYKQINE